MFHGREKGRKIIIKRGGVYDFMYRWIGVIYEWKD